MTLLDVSMATAARSQVPEMGVVTIEMKTSFMQPGLVGPLVAKGELMHRTVTMAFTQATVFDAHGAQVRPCHRHLQVREAPAHGHTRRPTR
jgi:acyl-coenzyme A thioesterase PaaI-like protein